MRQWLLIDADDTLWENNIYFEEAFIEFVNILNHPTLTPKQIRRVLDEIELHNNKINGYGSLNFGRNLQECYRKLSPRPVTDHDLEKIMAIARRLFDHPIELRDGVPETLGYLQQQHHLILFTKGHPAEQLSKVERSELKCFFDHIEVVKEKDQQTYAALVRKLNLSPQHTWMIGNSPKSDINPALAIGLNAVLVPHPRTWHLEKEPIMEGKGHLLVVTCFSDLRKIF